MKEYDLFYMEKVNHELFSFEIKNHYELLLDEDSLPRKFRYFLSSQDILLYKKIGKEFLIKVKI